MDTFSSKIIQDIQVSLDSFHTNIKKQNKENKKLKFKFMSICVHLHYLLIIHEGKFAWIIDSARFGYIHQCAPIDIETRNRPLNPMLLPVT
jgi:hypothetical protein